MDSFWYWALLGGVLIGTSVAIMLFMLGKIAGMSGLLYGSVVKPNKDKTWKASFLVGLILSGFLMSLFYPHKLAGHIDSSLWTLALAGFLVGFGTRLGSGCTSGHGVSGVSRFSPRSIIATLTFMIAGILSVYFFRTLGIISL